MCAMTGYRAFPENVQRARLYEHFLFKGVFTLVARLFKLPSNHLPYLRTGFREIRVWGSEHEGVYVLHEWCSVIRAAFLERTLVNGIQANIRADGRRFKWRIRGDYLRWICHAA